MGFDVKRVYEAPSDDDGLRVLVDRLWPRGLSKADAHVDRWIKEVAPSSDLRTWFGHDPARFDEFARRYREELRGSAELAELAALADDGRQVTLLYGARDEQHNQAVVLRDVVASYREVEGSGSGA
ncbi:DUF488 domain-containing protein [Isoptericola cucumis]|uniref:DNA-3-methyladenine glycosylase n=1 Tax=Isoptericola cucumis TaxID=1776856 RepID=A0ABQ2B6U1_9MICO|nr:DUF488 family protein [Isoptericola cucumis]GGI06605.1 hypothetical protein GCM10007368_12000 [Isoptericola cucumis]